MAHKTAQSMSPPSIDYNSLQLHGLIIHFAHPTQSMSCFSIQRKTIFYIKTLTNNKGKFSPLSIPSQPPLNTDRPHENANKTMCHSKAPD